MISRGTDEFNQCLAKSPSTYGYVPVKEPDKEDSKAMRDGSRRVACEVELEEHADQDPENCHHNKACQQRLPPTKAIDRIQGCQRHYCTSFMVSRY